MQTTISQIHEKVQKLIAAHNKLQKELLYWQQKAEEQALLLQNQKQTIKLLKSDAQTVRMATGIGGGENAENKFETKRKINELVSEIDKCIELLKTN